MKLFNFVILLTPFIIIIIYFIIKIYIIVMFLYYFNKPLINYYILISKFLFFKLNITYNIDFIIDYPSIFYNRCLQ